MSAARQPGKERPAPGEQPGPALSNPSRQQRDKMSGTPETYRAGQVFATWREDIAEVHRRLEAMDGYDRLGRRLLVIECGLWPAAWDRGGLSKRGGMIRAEAVPHRAGLLLLDDLAGAYHGSLSDARGVPEFLDSWRRWGAETDIAVTPISREAPPPLDRWAHREARD